MKCSFEMVMRIGIVYYEKKYEAPNSTTSYIYLLSLEYSPHATRTFHPNIMRIVIATQNCQYMLKIDDIV